MRCCEVLREEKTPERAPHKLRRARSVLSWLLSGALLLLVPKCPACLAAYIFLFTGLSLPPSFAEGLRTALIVLGAAVLIYKTSIALRTLRTSRS